VTRLSEFSPNEQLFTLSQFFKIGKVNQMLGLPLSTKKSYVLILINNGLDCILGGFLTNSPGHRDQQLFME
jgi:hypothetical protein